jgi:hypothetical protein
VFENDLLYTVSYITHFNSFLEVICLIQTLKKQTLVRALLQA